LRWFLARQAGPGAGRVKLLQLLPEAPPAHCARAGPDAGILVGLVTRAACSNPCRADGFARGDGPRTRVRVAYDGHGFTAYGGGAPATLTIRSTVSGFLALGLRREDPDTLFFTRRLVMTGDTTSGWWSRTCSTRSTGRAAAAARRSSEGKTVTIDLAGPDRAGRRISKRRWRCSRPATGASSASARRCGAWCRTSPRRAPNEQARTAAANVMRYFDTSAKHHHADEEEDLFPALVESMAASDAVCLRGLIDGLKADHRALETALAAPAPGAGKDRGRRVRRRSTPTTSRALVGLYERHMGARKTSCCRWRRGC